MPPTVHAKKAPSPPAVYRVERVLEKVRAVMSLEFLYRRQRSLLKVKFREVIKREFVSLEQLIVPSHEGIGVMDVSDHYVAALIYLTIHRVNKIF